MEVTMRCYARITRLQQYIQQTYAVCSAAHGYQNRLAFLQQPVLTYICTNSAQQIYNLQSTIFNLLILYI